MSDVLKEEFRKVKAEALDLIAVAQKENRDLSGEESEANAKRFARCNQIKSQLDEQAKFAALDVPNVPEAVMQAAKGNPAESKAKQEFDAGRSGKMTAERHHEAVNQFMRHGLSGLSAEQFTIVSGAGGVTLPAGAPVVIKRQRNPYKAALAAFGYQILNVSGFGNVPIFDDTANSAVVIAQDSTAHNVAEPTVVNLTGDVLYDSQAVWLSNTYLGQAGFDPLGYLRPMLDARIEAAESTAWTTATIAGAAVGVTGSSTTGITYAELVALKYSLPVAGRNDGVFFLSSGLMQNVESMIDDNGRPLYRDSLSDDAPDRLLGWPVFVVETLAAPAANAKSAVVASAAALVAREFGPRRMTIYENDKDKPDQTGYRMFANGGFGLLPAHVKVYKQSA